MEGTVSDDSMVDSQPLMLASMGDEEAEILADALLAAQRVPPYSGSKWYVFLRHGHSTWNQQGRIQGRTNESALTEEGVAQALRARDALRHIPFDSCFTSPHARALQTAQLVWAGRKEPLEALESIAEADLGWFQGQRNIDIARDHPELYRTWREEPESFSLDGRYPVADAFEAAHTAWSDLARAPGSTHLVITHKSKLRAMLCTALGLPLRQFRAIDLANACVCMVRSTARGDVMLSALNLTSHLHHDGVSYQLAAQSKLGTLVAKHNESGAVAL